MSFKDYRVARERMVREQIIEGGITDPRVLDAMRAVPRHLFLDHEAGSEAYSNHAFPIGYSQTMSQPYMVAYLAQELALQGNERILEIGTGSGYQAAVLSRLAATVCSVERIPGLARRAEEIFERLRIGSVTVKTADGARGWAERAPFDRILMTAAASNVPEGLLKQLAEGGFLLGPVADGKSKQHIVRLTRRQNSFHLEKLRGCSFVPLVRSPSDSPGTSSPQQPAMPPCEKN